MQEITLLVLLLLFISYFRRLLAEIVREEITQSGQSIRPSFYNLKNSSGRDISIIEMGHIVGQERQKKALEPTVQINIGSNSIVQYQQGNTLSHQLLDNQAIDSRLLASLVTSIQEHLPALKGYLTTSSASDLETDVNYLGSHLQRLSTDQSLVKKLGKSIKDVLQAVPANIIANILTPDLISILASF